MIDTTPKLYWLSMKPLTDNDALLNEKVNEILKDQVGSPLLFWTLKCINETRADDLEYMFLHH